LCFHGSEFILSSAKIATCNPSRYPRRIRTTIRIIYNTGGGPSRAAKPLPIE